MDRVPLTGLAAGKCGTSIPLVYDGTGVNVTSGRFFLCGSSAYWRMLCYPEISRETKPKKKKKIAPTTAERADNKNTKLPAAGKTTLKTK